LLPNFLDGFGPLVFFNGDAFIQPVYGLPVSTRYEMPVNIDRHFNAAVAHLIADVCEPLAWLD